MFASRTLHVFISIGVPVTTTTVAAAVTAAALPLARTVAVAAISTVGLGAVIAILRAAGLLGGCSGCRLKKSLHVET
jgi:lipid-binding SYLF domain-containing protein